ARLRRRGRVALDARRAALARDLHSHVEHALPEPALAPLLGHEEARHRPRALVPLGGERALRLERDEVRARADAAPAHRAPGGEREHAVRFPALDELL